MGLFQKIILNNFVRRFAYHAESELKGAYSKFQQLFQNPKAQAVILASKEETYQRTFLTAFFEEVLRYVHHPKDNHNLEPEKKNPNDSRKADGVLLKNANVIAVIELKLTKTHLDLVVRQAFSYLTAHKQAKYVLTSNFMMLRFYLDKETDYEESNLFQLDYEEFKKMYALLCPATILDGGIEKLVQDSLAREQEITADFYEKYQNFKDSLFYSLYALNKGTDALLLIQKAQKLLDRIIFMYFASSRGLLPANHVHIIIKEWKEDLSRGRKETLFDRLKAHFEFINSGFHSEQYEIYAYNGGLFAKDAVMDKLKIDSRVLEEHCSKLLQYDYVSDIDVSVLGNIFEYSLNESEQKRKELLQGAQNIDAGKDVTIENKRKIDGIFYTPIYITNYTIQETLGKLCADKKDALDLNSQNEEIDMVKIEAYSLWLSTVRVLDPACGSGAFLNQVLSFFIQEFSWIERLKQNANLDKKPKDKNKHFIHTILENNIFGVDLNEESVAITKLSLWLKTAQMYQKLNNLTENIKVGNSLITDKNLHEKAFDWAKEFPSPMGEGGFTLIVGNPPYGAHLADKIKKYLQKMKPLVPDFESYYYFIDKALELLQPEGKVSFIIPNTFLSNQFAQKFRANLLENHTITALSDLSAMKVFDEA